MDDAPARTPDGVTDGFYNNWWQYIVNYDEAVQEAAAAGRDLRKGQSGDVCARLSPG